MATVIFHPLALPGHVTAFPLHPGATVTSLLLAFRTFTASEAGFTEIEFLIATSVGPSGISIWMLVAFLKVKRGYLTEYARKCYTLLFY